jgi:hypothetical protein
MKNIAPSAIEFFHDLPKLAYGQTLLKIFDPVQSAVSQSDFAGEGTNGLISSPSSQKLCKKPVIQVHFWKLA